MTTAPIDPSTTDAWSALKSHREDVRGISLRDVFDQDAKRGERYVLEAGDLYVDYSKNLITDDTIDLLVQLAEQTGVEAKRDAMFAGEHYNSTEDRAVLHTALRLPRGESLTVDGIEIACHPQREFEGRDVVGAFDRLMHELRVAGEIQSRDGQTMLVGAVEIHRTVGHDHAHADHRVRRGFAARAEHVVVVVAAWSGQDAFAV